MYSYDKLFNDTRPHWILQEFVKKNDKPVDCKIIWYRNIGGLGEEYLLYPDKTLYRGDFDSHKKRHGYGTLMKENRAVIYKGYWMNNNRHGYGRSFDKNTGIYSGYWKNGKKHGDIGVYETKGGAKYVGSWYEDKREGWGILTFPDKSVYEGYWQNDMMNGKGTIKVPIFNKKGRKIGYNEYPVLCVDDNVCIQQETDTEFGDVIAEEA